jgi:hypothetical protein
VQAIDQVRLSRVSEARGLAAEDCLGESAVEEGIFHVELLNEPVTGDSSGEHRANGGQFYNRTEGLIVVNFGALSETPKDTTDLVAIKDPISTELVCEDPLAGDNIGVLRSGNQLSGPILIRALYSSSIVARQWGSASTARAKEEIGDGVGEEVAVVRARRAGTTLKPILPRVIIRCGLSVGMTGTTTPGLPTEGHGRGGVEWYPPPGLGQLRVCHVAPGRHYPPPGAGQLWGYYVFPWCQHLPAGSEQLRGCHVSPWLRLPPPGSRQLRGHYVSYSSDSLLLAQGSFGGAMCPRSAGSHLPLDVGNR